MKRQLTRTCLVFALVAALGAVFAGPASATVAAISGSMEGAIKISPGDWVSAGYRFSIPGSHPAETVWVASAQVSLSGPCTNGGSATVVVPLSAGPYTVLANDNNWWPTGDQQSAASFQGAVQAPAGLCGGTGKLDASAGADFSADLQSTDQSNKISVSFHYRDPAAKGQPNVDCSNVESANWSSSTCGASWSGTPSYFPDVPVPMIAIGGILLSILMCGVLLARQRRLRRAHAATVAGN